MIQFERIRSNASAALWTVDASAFAWWKAAPLHLLRLLYAVARDLGGGQLSLRAMSLVYTTLLSLVPLLAISFSVLKGFGVHNQIEPLLIEVLTPLGDKGAEIASRVIEFVDNVKVGVLGTLGLVLLVYTVISLMQKIERAFNYCWQVGQDRSFLKRFSHYLSAIVVGPILIFTSLGIKATVMGSSAAGTLFAIEPVGAGLRLAGQVVPYLLIIAAFTFLYMFVPNTRVRLGSALVGATVAGVLWQTVGWVFASYVVSSAKYSAIYSAFATLVMFMIWLYVAWLILLIGTSIAFYHQNPSALRARRGGVRLSSRVKEKLALLVVARIARAFARGEPGWTTEALSLELDVPAEAVEQTLAPLERERLLVRTAAEPPAWIPARPLDAIALNSVLDAVRKAGEEGPSGAIRLVGEAVLDDALGALERARTSTLAGRTLAELAAAPAPRPRILAGASPP